MMRTPWKLLVGIIWYYFWFNRSRISKQLGFVEFWHCSPLLSFDDSHRLLRFSCPRVYNASNQWWNVGKCLHTHLALYKCLYLIIKVYGSPDGGITLRRRSLQFENFMIELSAKFHLKQHQVGSGDSSVYFCTPADLEGHRGKGLWLIRLISPYLDGNWYVIDLARLMPPLFPQPK